MPASFMTPAVVFSSLFFWFICVGARAETSCTADFSLLGQGLVQVSIKPRSDGLYDAVVNGVSVLSRASTEERVRPDLNMNTDPYGPEYAALNGAEKSLIHIHRLLESPETRGIIKVPFDPKKVGAVKTYDLMGKTDKFGGAVLLEAFTPEGAFLGRVLRRVLVAACV